MELFSDVFLCVKQSQRYYEQLLWLFNIIKSEMIFEEIYELLFAQVEILK